MSKLVYTTLASLDGFVEDTEGGFDWAFPDEEVHAFANDLERPVATHLLHAARHHLEGVDVETGVGLVEDRDVGLEDRHLEDLVALLLAAGEPLVEEPVGEGRVHVETGHPLHDRQAQS